MSNISEQLHMYLSHSFVLYALIVGVSIALCAAMVGVTLVLKRFSFIGDGPVSYTHLDVYKRQDQGS